jgi:hypothetical protein
VQVPEEWPPLHPSSDHDHGTNTNPVEGVDYPLNEMVAVNAGTVELGKPSDFPSYGWDNEYGHRTMEGNINVVVDVAVCIDLYYGFCFQY